ncbi:MAG: Spy/CpxP family protein refolding chaperone, partial [Gammaproteobacteria bacterium]
MKKSTKLIGVAALVVGLSTTAFAFTGNGHWKMTSAEKAEFMSDRIASKLELTCPQKQELSTLTDELLDMVSEIKETRHEHKLLIQQLLSEPTLDQAKALDMIRQTTQMVNDKSPKLIASLAGFLDSLNVE